MEVSQNVLCVDWYRREDGCAQVALKSQSAVPSCAAFFNTSAAGLYVSALDGAFGPGNSTAAPGSAVTASVTALGGCGEAPEPEPAAPPLLIITMVPLMKTPAALMLMKFPPTFRVSDAPVSIVSVVPDFRW